MLMRMDETEKFKAFLDSAADGYSDPQIRQLRREMHAMAELLLDIYLYKEAQQDPSSPRPARFDRLPPSP